MSRAIVTYIRPLASEVIGMKQLTVSSIPGMKANH